jgi:hypothetical protein
MSSGRSRDAAFRGNGRFNYHPEQFRTLYLSADDDNYLAGFSYPGFTLVDGSLYLLATRLSTLAKQRCLFPEVAEFLITIRRPLCRFLVYVGELSDVDEKHGLFRYAFYGAREVFGGDNAIWGDLPYVDGVRILPPVQLGIPFRHHRRLDARFSKDIPRVWIDEERCVEVQRQHVVFAVTRLEPSGVWSYVLRDYIRTGGRTDCAQFTGLRHYMMGQGSVVALAGMVRGRHGYAVGQFGALLRSDASETYFRNGYGPSREVRNLHIPCTLDAVHVDRKNWPVRERPDGSTYLVDPGAYEDRPDILV